MEWRRHWLGIFTLFALAVVVGAGSHLAINRYTQDRQQAAITEYLKAHVVLPEPTPLPDSFRTEFEMNPDFAGRTLLRVAPETAYVYTYTTSGSAVTELEIRLGNFWLGDVGLSVATP